MDAIVNRGGGQISGSRLMALAAAAIGLCLFPNAVNAQALYYRSIPVGERAIGLGGAFIGVASDPSATYYNPAGMMRGGGFELLGSFSSIVFTRQETESAFEAQDIDESFSSGGTTTLPRFIGTVVKVGPRKYDNDRKFALGYSTLEVARGNAGVGITENDAELTLDLRTSNNYRSRWYGVSFAAQLSEKSAFGFSIFLSDQRFRYSEDIGFARGGNFDEQTGVRVGGDSVTTSGVVSADAYHFVPRLGWLHKINPDWQVGVMLQLPGIPLKQKANVLRRITSDVSPGPSTFSLFDQDGVKTRMPIPFELGAGFGFHINASTLLAVDASVTGPVRDNNFVSEPEQLAQIDGTLGVYFSNSTERRWTPNVAIGVEHLFGKVVVAGGLFTNISAAPNVPETSNEYTPNQVNMYGASVSVGVDTKGYRLTVGGTGMYGKGKALAAVVDPNLQVADYQRTTSTRSVILLYIAGAVSVATKGAKQVSTKLKEKKHEDDETTDGEREGPD